MSKLKPHFFNIQSILTRVSSVIFLIIESIKKNVSKGNSKFYILILTRVKKIKDNNKQKQSKTNWQLLLHTYFLEN